MKNSSMKRILSAVMAIMMVAGATSATAYATEVKNLDNLTAGDNIAVGFDKLTMPVIEVEVPTAPAITIDPYQIAEKGQIYSEEVSFVNYSTIPLSIEFNTIKVTGSTNVKPVTKAPSATATEAGDKWAVVNFTVTDGSKKSSSTVIDPGASDGVKSVVKTAMAPLGGEVTYEITGTCNINPTNAWTGGTGGTGGDTVSVSAKYKFASNTFATYSVANAPTFWDKNLANTKEIQTTSADTTTASLLAKLPKTMSNGGKELPVVWMYNNGTSDGLLSKKTNAVLDADTVVYPAIPTYGDIYGVSTTNASETANGALPVGGSTYKDTTDDTGINAKMKTDCAITLLKPKTT